MRIIDHLVYCVTDLKKATKDLSQKCGVEVIYGGRHLTKGTENALLNLSNGAYLELLAIDPTNKDIVPPRWMGIDLIDQFTFTRWAIKSNDLAPDIAILKKANPLMGEVFEGSRQKTDGSTLRWAMALPLASPAVEVLPFMVDWKDSVHPTASLETGCVLVGLELTHPTPAILQSTIDALQIDLMVKKGPTPNLKAMIETPKGRIQL